MSFYYDPHAWKCVCGQGNAGWLRPEGGRWLGTAYGCYRCGRPDWCKR